jgi:predicted acetyltransferase
VTDELPIRLATAADLPELDTVISAAFLHDAEDETNDLHRLVYEPERSHVVTDGRIVGTGAVLTRSLTVPGAVIPAAHVTAVAVAATHRRRGLLTRIMTAQLESVRERGDEPIAVLWASEGAIYGRFGYGLACWQVQYEIPTRETMPPLTPSTARLRQAVPRDVIDELAQVYDRVQPERPGRSGRNERWWKFLTADPKPWRRDLSAQRTVLYEADDGSVDGYAIWRVKGGWSASGPSGEVAVNEVVAATEDAYASLWRFLLSIDLTRTVKFSFAALDEPLPHLVSNPNALETHVFPGLWIRLVDLPGALSARRYARPVDVVLDVSDGLLPGNAGRWRLVGDETAARCDPADALPDITLDIRALSAAYLGGISMHSLAEAGLITENTPGSLVPASAAFGWPVAPASWEIF